MECGEVSSVRSPYIDGELDQATKKQVDEHLAICPRCRAAVEALRAVVRSVRDRLARQRAPEHVRERILDGISRSPASR